MTEKPEDTTETVKVRLMVCVQSDGGYTGEGWKNAHDMDMIRAIEDHHQIDDLNYHFVAVEAEVPLPRAAPVQTVQGRTETMDPSVGKARS